MGKLNLGIFLLVCNLCISVFASVPDKYSLGIAPQDESYYKSNVIKCKDGSRKFTREQLNDEFCDCPDGTDEPGTSACPEGRFYCQNAGHTPLTLFSSRVNDGICGKEKEFYSFYDHCFESKQNKYVYKVCPFKQASQVEGHSTTLLGQWKKFEESYRIMQFSKGERCWNGPDRSLKVRLRCGLTNELADVDEPSRCEYLALLSTPALCEEDKLQELQQKLELMNTRHPQSRDEL